MYLTLTISAVVCRRGDVHDAEVAFRSDRIATNVVVGKNLPFPKVKELSEEKTQELYDMLENTASQWLANYPKAKE